MVSIHAKGRDNARTPMQWDGTRNAGFTSGTPWLKVNPNHAFINASTQIDNEQSVFNYYRTLIDLRKKHPVFIEGDFKLLLPDDEDIFAYMREYEGVRILVVANFHAGVRSLASQLTFVGWTPLIANYQDDMIYQPILRAYEARIYMAT